MRAMMAIHIHIQRGILSTGRTLIAAAATKIKSAALSFRHHFCGITAEDDLHWTAGDRLPQFHHVRQLIGE